MQVSGNLRYSRSSILGAFVFFLMIVHATFRGITSDLDAIVYAGFLKEVSDLSFYDFIQRLQESGWIFQAREDSIARFEWGFAVFSWLTTRLGYSLPFSFGAIATFSLIPKYIALRRYTLKPALGALWYLTICYPVLEMSAVRAGVAAGILVGFLGLLKDGRYFRYALAVFCAATFHLSALVGLLLIVCKYIERFQSARLVLLVLGVGLVLGQLVAMESISQHVSKLSEYKSEMVAGGLYATINIVNSVTVLMVSVYWIVILNFRGGLGRSGCRFWRVIFILPIFVFIVASSFPVVAARLFELLTVFQIFLVSFPKSYYFRNSRLVMLFILFVVVSFFLIQQFRVQNVNYLYPFLAPTETQVEYFELKVGSDLRLYNLWLEGLD